MSGLEWGIGKKHPAYGTVTMCRTIEGEPYRFFTDKHGTVSMIPLLALTHNAPTIKLSHIKGGSN